MQIEFVKRWGPYYPRDRAGFARPQALALIAAKIAQPINVVIEHQAVVELTVPDRTDAAVPVSPKTGAPQKRRGVIKLG